MHLWKDIFCLSRVQKQQQQERQQSRSPHGATSSVCLHKRTSSSCVFTETPLLQVPPRAQMHSRARLPDTWLDDRRRRKLCSWELERLQRLLEHSATAMFADSASASNVGGDGGGGIDSSTSPTTTTTTATSPPPPNADLEERLSAQMAQRFNKMELNLLELEEKMTTTFVSLLSHLQCLQTHPRADVDASTMTEMVKSGDEEEIEVNVRLIDTSNGDDL
ncbi:unnamed protein product [Hydatigera taeniaeformis]|uniref:Uncharacterized protein n=1 Tax=Hydatigena taeniaeformis TaxID=6205 RepID=A0A0R3X7U5_HYDTA|nr:unnamed protein product [Hydatigera taeniaeformis]